MDIIHKNTIIARHIKPTEWKEGLSFFSQDEEYIQVGAWNYNKGKELLGHIHNVVDRTVKRTEEVLYIVSGKIQATLYDLQGNSISSFEAIAGDVIVLLECGHGYTILEDGTKVLEVKNGPYLGADVDRKRIV